MKADYNDCWVVLPNDNGDNELEHETCNNDLFDR